MILSGMVVIGVGFLIFRYFKKKEAFELAETQRLIELSQLNPDWDINVNPPVFGQDIALNLFPNLVEKKGTKKKPKE